MQWFKTIIQQYGDRYTGRWWVGCYIWYSCTKCNEPAVNGQLFHVAAVNSKALSCSGAQRVITHTRLDGCRSSRVT